MRRWEILCLAMLSSPSIYALLLSFSAFREPHPFLLLGAVTLLAVPLLSYSTEVLLASIYIPAAVSFGFFLLAGQPDLLLNLAVGYLIAVPLFALTAAYTEPAPQSLALAYFGGLLLDIYLIRIALEGALTAGMGFRGPFLESWRGLLTAEMFKVSDLAFAALAALSAAALLWRVIDQLKPSKANLLADNMALAALLASALMALGIAVLSNFLSGAAWVIALLLGGGAVVFLAAYPRMVKD